MSETTAHQSLVEWLNVYGAPRYPDLAYVWHTPNESAGGAKTRRGAPLDVLKEASMGVRAGVWDFLLIRPQWGVAIELKSDAAFKRKHNGLSADQLRWQRYYTGCGWLCAVFPESRWHEAALLLVECVGGDPTQFRFS